MWFYQDVEDTEQQIVVDPKPGTSRQLQSTSTRTQAVSAPVMKKKLFLTDGWNVPLTGICIYIFRTNTTKQLPEEGFQKVNFLYVELFVIRYPFLFILGFILWYNRCKTYRFSYNNRESNRARFYGSFSTSKS